MFDEELEFFKVNQEALVKKHRGKFLVIKGKQVIGVYASALDAFFGAQTQHEVGSFMIQPCDPGPDAYTVTIASASIARF